MHIEIRHVICWTSGVDDRIQKVVAFFVVPWLAGRLADFIDSFLRLYVNYRSGVP